MSIDATLGELRDHALKAANEAQSLEALDQARIAFAAPLDRKFMIYKRIPEAYWFDDYLNAPEARVEEYPMPEPEMDLWTED